MMKITDFCDMKEFGTIMENWARATGLATVAVGDDGKYISDCYNFTDFCIKLTRGTEAGRELCEECDREGHGVYHCHAGLIDFAIDLVVDGQKLGQVIGGQVLPENPDEDKFRQKARDIGVDPDRYIEALKKVNVRSEDAINASANLLGEVLNNFINAEYYRYITKSSMESLQNGVEAVDGLVRKAVACTDTLKNIQKRQKIVAINARIEASRVGQYGRGFGVVAEEVRKLSESSSQANATIEKYITDIQSAVYKMREENRLEAGNGEKEE